MVDGLVDNLNDQKTGLTVTITSASNAGSLPRVFTDADYLFGSGFDVANGQVTGVDIQYFDVDLLGLANNNITNFNTEFTDGTNGLYTTTDTGSSSNSLLFTPVASASVPGPLPLFGAGAAFAWSRRLRRRIKSPA